MALLFGPEGLTISCPGPNFDRVKVFEALRTLFPSRLHVIVRKSATNEALTVENTSFDKMERAVANMTAS